MGCSKPDFKYVKRFAERLAPELKGQESTPNYHTHVLLLSALLVGTDVDPLATFTGYSRGFVAHVASRMRKAGLWRKGAYDGDHLFRDGLLSPVIFAADVLVAGGFMEAERLPSGKYRRWLAGRTHRKSGRRPTLCR